jgi:hypothetical protein
VSLELLDGQGGAVERYAPPAGTLVYEAKDFDRREPRTSPRSGKGAPVSRPLGNGELAAPIMSEFGTLTGDYSEGGVDGDSDGRFESLRVSVGIKLTSPLWTNVVVWLVDSADTPLGWAAKAGDLADGSHTVDVFFPGPQLVAAGRNGPYRVSHVEFRLGEEDEELADAADNVLTTAAYPVSAFTPAPVVISGPYSDVGADSNGDGQFDWLRVNVGLQVDVAGSYTVVGELAGSGPIVAARSTTIVSSGAPTVSLWFSGANIYQSRQDGPYRLSSVRVEDASGAVVDIRPSAHTTASYNHAQFAHPGTVLDPTGHSDHGVDLDGDGRYDYLVADLHVNADAPSSVTVSALLQDGSLRTVTEARKSVTLSSGTNTIALGFSGAAIRAHGVDGPFRVTNLTLVRSDGRVLDTQPFAYQTAGYLYSQFSWPLLGLTGQYSDATRDSNGNGRADFLDIQVGVRPRSNGVAIVQGRLVGAAGKEIGWASVTGAVTGGQTTMMTLSFAGSKIYAAGVDGPYTLKNLLAYHTGDPGQSVYVEAAHVTAAYQHTQFESGGADYYTLTPCRVLDTRNPAGALGGPALGAGAIRTFLVTGACLIPSTASAVSANLTAVGAASPGYLTLFPGDASGPPTVSNVNFTPGLTRANNAVVLLATDGTGRIKVKNGSAGAVHFVLDVNGYFQ